MLCNEKTNHKKHKANIKTPGYKELKHKGQQKRKEKTPSLRQSQKPRNKSEFQYSLTTIITFTF